MQDTLEASAPQAAPGPGLAGQPAASDARLVAESGQYRQRQPRQSRRDGRGHALAERLQAAGVPVQFRPYPVTACYCGAGQRCGRGRAHRAHGAYGHGIPPVRSPSDLTARKPARLRPWRGRHEIRPGAQRVRGRSLCTLRWPEAPLHLFFSCDEEIGSPATRDLIMDRVRGARAVFNAEPGRVSGNVVTSRKGSMLVEFEVEGVAAHAGINHAAGASAIDALARKTLALHALTDPATGVTANVGVVHGGVVSNMVAPMPGRSWTCASLPTPTRGSAGPCARHHRRRKRAAHPGPHHRGPQHLAHENPRPTTFWRCTRRARARWALKCRASSQAAQPTAASLPRWACPPCAPPGPWAATRTPSASIAS